MFFLTDIQECYEVTLQLNTEQSVMKEDSRQDAWEVIFLLHIMDWQKYVKCLHFTCAIMHCLLAALKVSKWHPQGVTTCVPHTPTWT